MCKAVIHLVVAYGGNVRAQCVHKVYRGQALILRVYDGAAEHVACHCVNDVLLLSADLSYVAAESGQSAHLLAVHFLGKKISVKVVGVEYR